MKTSILKLVMGALLLVAGLNAGEPVYKIGGYLSPAEVKARLESSGYTIVADQSVTKGTNTIVFTSDLMKKNADKKMRGFNAMGRILVDTEKKNISIANPVYFGEAFMQSEHKKASSEALLVEMVKLFGSLTPSSENMSMGEIAKYHFMMGMPYYEDMENVALGEADALVAKAKASGSLAGVIKINRIRQVAFINLSSRTSGFFKKIGGQGAHLLPYPVLLEDGEAKILHPKYLIALSYPALTMSEFMKIATIPDAIIKDVEKAFK